jgi:hypothetical protein
MEDCEEASAQSSDYGDADNLERCDDDLEDDELVMPNSGSSDQGSSKALLLPSMFKCRATTVWFEYPAYMGMERQEMRGDVVEVTDER